MFVLQNPLAVVRSMSDIADILSSNGGSLSSTSEPGSLRSLSASVPPSSCSSKLECKLLCCHAQVLLAAYHEYAVVVLLEWIKT